LNLRPHGQKQGARFHRNQFMRNDSSQFVAENRLPEFLRLFRDSGRFSAFFLPGSETSSQHSPRESSANRGFVAPLSESITQRRWTLRSIRPKRARLRAVYAPMCQGPGVQRYASANIVIGSRDPDHAGRKERARSTGRLSTRRIPPPNRSGPCSSRKAMASDRGWGSDEPGSRGADALRRLQHPDATEGRPHFLCTS
jgi:hypothetical protein